MTCLLSGGGGGGGGRLFGVRASFTTTLLKYGSKNYVTGELGLTLGCAEETLPNGKLLN
jgi:hypothetical protein